jgi:hypothetical protein
MRAAEATIAAAGGDRWAGPARALKRIGDRAAGFSHHEI